MIITAVLTCLAGLLAWMGHPWGVAPIVAAVLCSAYFLRTRDVLIVGVGAMLLRDLLVGPSAFTVVRVAAILFVVGLVALLRVRGRLRMLLPAVVLAVPLYHVMLTAGDWLTQTCATEPRTLAGLQATFASAWPYMIRTGTTELAFTALFLGAYALAGVFVRSRWTALLPQTPSR